MLNKMRFFLGLSGETSFVHEGPYGGVDRDQAGTFRTPKEKKAYTNARAKDKAAKLARKRNRR